MGSWLAHLDGSWIWAPNPGVSGMHLDAPFSPNTVCSEQTGNAFWSHSAPAHLRLVPGCRADHTAYARCLLVGLLLFGDHGLRIDRLVTPVSFALCFLMSSHLSTCHVMWAMRSFVWTPCRVILPDVESRRVPSARALGQHGVASLKSLAFRFRPRTSKCRISSAASSVNVNGPNNLPRVSGNANVSCGQMHRTVPLGRITPWGEVGRLREAAPPLVIDLTCETRTAFAAKASQHAMLALAASYAARHSTPLHSLKALLICGVQCVAEHRRITYPDALARCRLMFGHLRRRKP